LISYRQRLLWASAFAILKVGRLARELARLRKTNMTEAIAHALRSEPERERGKRPLEDRLEDLANETMSMAKPGGHMTTKDEIDALWGQQTSLETIASACLLRRFSWPSASVIPKRASSLASLLLCAIPT